MTSGIVLIPHDPDWQRRFEKERSILETVLAPWLRNGIHHIGSTAIPGLAAKPIIDMIAGVGDLDKARAAFEPLSGLSYVHTPHRPGIAHHFSKPSSGLVEISHALHLTEPGSDLWQERLAFRDALRNDPTLVRDYGSLKQRLAEQHPQDLDAYTAGKREFIGAVLASSGLTFGRR